MKLIDISDISKVDGFIDAQLIIGITNYNKGIKEELLDFFNKNVEKSYPELKWYLEDTSRDVGTIRYTYRDLIDKVFEGQQGPPFSIDGKITEEEIKKMMTQCHLNSISEEKLKKMAYISFIPASGIGDIDIYIDKDEFVKKFNL